MLSIKANQNEMVLVNIFDGICVAQNIWVTLDKTHIHLIQDTSAKYSKACLTCQSLK